MRPDYLRLRDPSNKVILCCQCGKSAADKRALVQCDYCQEYWHLDCCDPPLAVPPKVSEDSTTRTAWRCRRHIHHDLASLPIAPARSYRTRKPKDSTIVEPTFSRGVRNNGIIEVVDELSEEEEEDVFDKWKKRSPEDGITYRLPPKGIILDFIDRVKQ